MGLDHDPYIILEQLLYIWRQAHSEQLDRWHLWHVHLFCCSQPRPFQYSAGSHWMWICLRIWCIIKSLDSQVFHIVFNDGRSHLCFANAVQQQKGSCAGLLHCGAIFLSLDINGNRHEIASCVSDVCKCCFFCVDFYIFTPSQKSQPRSIPSKNAIVITIAL